MSGETETHGALADEAGRKIEAMLEPLPVVSAHACELRQFWQWLASALRHSTGDAGAVEREPTDAMVEAGMGEGSFYDNLAAQSLIRDIWRAMFDAAPASRPTEAPEADRLARLEAENERMRVGLQDIINPIGALNRMAEEEGSQLNGSAWEIAKDPALLQSFASLALKEPTDATD